MTITPIADLTTRPPFSDLFPVDEETVKTLAGSMRTNGYSPAKPIAVYSGPDHELLVVDGHQRLAAAQLAGLKEVDTFLVKLATERAAWEYAVAEQRDRRNLSREELAALMVRVFREVKRTSTPPRSATRGLRRGAELPVSSDEPTGDDTVVEKVAGLTGQSKGTVKKVQQIVEHGDEETLAAVEAKKLTVGGAYAKVKGRQGRRRGIADESAPRTVPNRLTPRRAEAALLGIEKRAELIAKAKALLSEDQRQRLARVAGELLGLAGGGSEPNEDWGGTG